MTHTLLSCVCVRVMSCITPQKQAAPLACGAGPPALPHLWCRQQQLSHLVAAREVQLPQAAAVRQLQQDFVQVGTARGTQHLQHTLGGRGGVLGGRVPAAREGEGAGFLQAEGGRLWGFCRQRGAGSGVSAARGQQRFRVVTCDASSCPTRTVSGRLSPWRVMRWQRDTSRCVREARTMGEASRFLMPSALILEQPGDGCVWGGGECVCVYVCVSPEGMANLPPPALHTPA